MIKSTRREANSIVSLRENGEVAPIGTTTLKYKWSLNKNTATYKMFASFFQIGATSTESHYRPKKNQTIIMTKPVDLDDGDEDDNSDARPTKVKLLGLVIPHISTNAGKVIISY